MWGFFIFTFNTLSSQWQLPMRKCLTWSSSQWNDYYDRSLSRLRKDRWITGREAYFLHIKSRDQRRLYIMEHCTSIPYGWESVSTDAETLTLHKAQHPFTYANFQGSYAAREFDKLTSPSITPHADLPQQIVPLLPQPELSVSPRTLRFANGLPDLRHVLGSFAPRERVVYTPRYYQCVRAHFSKDEPMVCFDTGCTMASSMDLEDFEEPPTRGDFGIMRTVNGSVTIEGAGIIRWKTTDENGKECFVRVPGYYIPKSEQRLMSPQHYAAFYDWGSKDSDCYGGNQHRMWLYIASEHETMQTLSMPVNGTDRLAYFRINTSSSGALAKSCSSCTKCQEQCPSCHLQAAFNLGVLHESNSNLTPSQKALLLDHQRLGHIHIDHLRSLYRVHDDGRNDMVESSSTPCLHVTPGVLTCSAPLCLACQLAKAKRRPSGATHSRKDPDRTHGLTQGHTTPGELVFHDHYESSVRGRLPHTRGREKHSLQYCGGSIFVDAASGLIKVYHQVTLGAGDTKTSKHQFEFDAAQCGVNIQTYHTDNGIFTSSGVRRDLQASDQHLRLSGVGAHFQNSLAERAIQTVHNSARAMMLHLSIHWPDQYDPNLWPFALDYAVWLYNHIPGRDSHVAPIELFCGVKQDCSYLRRARVFGCPTYVLDPKLQDGKKIPKWKPRARMGQFLGFSPTHSSTVGLVRNLVTGAVSPQFHTIHDQSFDTVVGGLRDRPLHELTDDSFRLYLRSKWNTSDHDHLLSDWDENVDGPLPDHPPYWDDAPPRIDGTRLPADIDKLQVRVTDRLPLPAPPAPSPPPAVTPRRLDDAFSQESPPSSPLLGGENLPSSPSVDATSGPGEPPQPPSLDESPGPGEAFPDDTSSPGETFEPPDHSSPSVPHSPPAPLPDPPRRSKRNIKRRVRLIEEGYHSPSNVFGFLTRRARQVSTYTRLLSSDTKAAMRLHWGSHATTVPTIASTFYNMDLINTCRISGDILHQHPLAFHGRLQALSDDEPSFSSVANLPIEEQHKWFDAIDAEFAALHDKGCLKLVPRNAAVGKEIVPSKWVLKRKRRPDGSLLKYKARLCIRGDRMREQVVNQTTGVHQTGYSPVVEWSTLRMLLALSVQYNLFTTQVDFKNAFVQASLDEPLYMSLPPGMQHDPRYSGSVLEVSKSLYGHKFAAKMFYELLRSNLVDKMNFTVSKHDHCLFLREDCMIVIWIDDAILLTKEETTADKVIGELRALDLDLDRETNNGGLAGYLGIDITKELDGSLTMTQTGLIDRIIEALDLGTANAKDTPAVDALGRCKDHPPLSAAYNYRSVCGMLLYLGNCTRPDISFAVHQCCRHGHDPREPHGTALKRIGTYLLGTRDKGMRMTLADSVPTLDCWVDADFAGLFGKEDPQDPTSARSRTGFVLTFGGNPIVWASKLQSETATSTMNAEYVALATGMRTLLHLRKIHAELTQTFTLPHNDTSLISTVFEDNESCINLAGADPPRLTPQSRTISTKYHWFREHIGGNIQLRKVDGSVNLANIFTKPLKRDQFQQERERLNGW